MNHISKLGGMFLPLLLSINAANVFAEDEAVDSEVWRRIYFQDFGGNAESDARFSSTALGGAMGRTDIADFSEGYLAVASGVYSIGKYAQNINGETNSGWSVGGDHTNVDNKESGYFLMLDCPQACGNSSSEKNPVSCDDLKLDYTENSVYEISLTQNICANVTFLFEAYIANMLYNDPTSTFVTLDILDGSGNVIWSYNDGVGKLLPPSSNSTSLDWTRISGTVKIPSSADLSSIKFRVNPVVAVTNGFDIGLDDIAIYIQQPSISFNHTEFEYKQPAYLTADVDLGSFFSDVNDVQFHWEYSANGTDGWTEVGGTRNYTDAKDFQYKITSFDKDDASGNGNGYYRLTIASSSDIDNITDQSVCCLRKVFQINELKNKVRLVLCENESQTIDGRTFTKADNGEEFTTKNQFVVTTEVIFNKDSVVRDEICVGKERNGVVYNTIDSTVGLLLSADEVIKSKRIAYSGEYCDSISISTRLFVVDKKKFYEPDLHGCAGSPADDGKTYTDVGTISWADSTQGDCEVHLYKLHVHPAYNAANNNKIVETTNECEGFTYNGKVYAPGTWDLPETKFKTYKYGCDSVEQRRVIVHANATKELEPVTICQSDFGVGKTSYKLGKHEYVNTGTTNMEFVAYDTIQGGSYLGCDSIVSQQVTIYPMMHFEADTLICRDQILFGLEWTKAGEYDHEMRFKTANGCDSVVTYHIKVLQIQLKLRADTKDNNVCEGQAATIHVEILPSSTAVTWTPEFSSPDPLNPKVSPTENTMYVAHAENRQAGCHATDSIYITVSPMPTLFIDSVDTSERTVTFTVNGGTPDYTYWLGTPQAENATVDFSSDKYYRQIESNGNVLEDLNFGTHLFRVVDEMGCAAEDTINLEPLPVEPATFLTPNGDGINDTWIIKNIEAYGNDAYIRIYTRFGKLVYESDRSVGYTNSTGFDGTFNGVKLPSTDYWYVIDIESIDRQYVGHFTLLR